MTTEQTTSETETQQDDLLDHMATFARMHALNELTTTKYYDNGYKATIVVEHVGDEDGE